MPTTGCASSRPTGSCRSRATPRWGVVTFGSARAAHRVVATSCRSARLALSAYVDPPGRLSFKAPELRRSGPVKGDLFARVAKGLRVAPGAIVAANWVDNGPGWLAILLRSRDEVLALRPDYSTLAGLRVGTVGAWKSGKDGPDAQFEVRAFTARGYEDPVTGSLNAGLAQWLIGTGVAPSSYVVSQGTALGRMGRVVVEQDRRSRHDVHSRHRHALEAIAAVTCPVGPDFRVPPRAVAR